MSTILPTLIDRPRLTKRAGTLSRLFGACMDEIVRYFVCRSAIASLRELDDLALKDIGLRRCQIEPAVHGLIVRPDRSRT
jgi:uncharacterized protein YjiS (DUF1127 family)